jgi:hypothetical protein
MSVTLPSSPAATPAEPPADAERWLRPPTFEEVHTGWMRYWATPIEILDPGCQHAGQFVAFFDGKPWGYDPDPTALRERVLASLEVHPNWVVISYLG